MRTALLALLLAWGAPTQHIPPQPPPDFGSGSSGSGSGSAAVAPPVEAVHYDAMSRADFNSWAVRTNTPLYWIDDKNGNKAIDADEVAPLLFYPTDAGFWRDSS